MVSKTEKWLIIDEFNANNPVFASLRSNSKASISAPATPVRNTLQTDPLAPTPRTPQQTPVRSKVVSTPQPPQSPLPPSTPTPVRSETPSQVSTTISQQKVTTQHKTVVSSRDTIPTGGEQSEFEQAEEQLNK